MWAKIADLANLSLSGSADLASLNEALRELTGVLGAEEAYVVQAGDPHFRRLDGEDPSEAHGIKQKGYWFLWKALADLPACPAGMALVEDRVVLSAVPAARGIPGSHLVSLLPSEGSNAEMLVIRGPWPAGLTESQLLALMAARPSLARIVAGLLDRDASDRRRRQVAALASVSKAFSEATDMSGVLTGIATSLAQASGFDWVTINRYDESLEKVTERGMNVARHSTTATAESVRKGQIDNLDPGGGLIRDVRDGRPLLLRDVFAGDRINGPLRTFFERAHIVSLAAFPLTDSGRVTGTVAFSASSRREFAPDEVEFLQLLTTQASAAIQGLRLYRELEASRDELATYARALEEMHEAAHALARSDALTGLPNRRHLEEVLKAEYSRAANAGQPLSIVLFDLDNLKAINDRWSHQLGDTALRRTAAVARATWRPLDFVGRWGGDEFLVLMPGATMALARSITRRFCRELGLAEFGIPEDSASLRLAASAGVAQALHSGEDAGDLIAAADAALYEAKRKGRNRVVAGRQAA